MRGIDALIGSRSVAAGRYRRAAALLGALFVALVAAVAGGLLRPLDLQLARAAHGGSPCWAVAVSDRASVLLAGELSLGYAGLLAVLCARRGRPLLGAWLIALLFATVALELVCKHWIDQPAPSALLGVARPDCSRAAYPLTSVAVPNSLPSGYAIRAAYFGVLLTALLGARRPPLGRVLRRGLGPTLILLGASRVVIAWHWPSDVLAGLLLGAAVACLALVAADGFEWLGPAAGSGRAAAGPRKLSRALGDRASE